MWVIALDLDLARPDGVYPGTWLSWVGVYLLPRIIYWSRVYLLVAGIFPARLCIRARGVERFRNTHDLFDNLSYSVA